MFTDYSRKETQTSLTFIQEVKTQFIDTFRNVANEGNI